MGAFCCFNRRSGNYGLHLNGSDVSFSRSLVSGTHTIAGTYRVAENSNHQLAFRYEFEVTSDDHYCQNNYAKLYPCTNGVSEFGAIRPVLFVEGFNVPGIMSGGANYTQSLVTKWKSSMSDSKIYMLSLNDPTDDVRNNAMVVLGALRYIHNNRLGSQLTEGTCIYGYSMGGILARYALAYAEQWNIPHYCTQYISLDSPQRGASINLNMQNMLNSLKNKLSSLDHSNDRLNDALEALDSPAAKQLIRENRYANSNSYNMGSYQYRNLFAEINEEDNYIHEVAGFPMSILNANYDSSYVGVVKPGFPYKQNNIKCLAYSNGGLELSGNINDESLAASWSLDVWLLPDDQYQALKCVYDRQPGSVFEDFSISDSGWFHDFELTQNYAPVIVPTRSSLYLKRNSISGGSPVPELDLNVNYLSSLTSHSNILLDHTYFDQIIHAPVVPYPITEAPIYDGNQTEVIIPHKADFNEWNWRHGELGWRPYAFDNWVASNITASANWLNQIDNRTVCTISGHINGSDFSDIAGTMLINGQENRAFNIDQNGLFQIPYLYTKNASVRLLFEKPGYLPTYRDICMTYSNAVLQDYTVSNVNMYAFNLNDIRVSSAGSGSFVTINAALDFIYDYVDSGLYAGEPIRIKVLTGTYDEDIYLCLLTDIGITSLTIEGWGNAIINGNGSESVFDLNTASTTSGVVTEFNLKNLKMTGSRRGIIFVDSAQYWDNNGELLLNDEPYDATSVLNIINCHVYSCGGSFNNSNLIEFAAAGIHFQGSGSINGCQIYSNTANSEDSPLTYPKTRQSGGIYILNNSTGTAEISNCKIYDNIGLIAGGIVAKGSGEIIIKSNEFWDNDQYGSTTEIQSIRARALSIYDAKNVNIQNNLIRDTLLPTSMGSNTIGIYTTENLVNLSVTNNTIINTIPLSNTNFTALYFHILYEENRDKLKIQNNIFSNTNSNTIGINKSNGFHPIHFNHNVLNNVAPYNFTITAYNPNDQNSQYTPNAPKFNYVCDPMLDQNYRPIWNATTMSHCIDTGTGTYDPDGTPPDIGAYPGRVHSYWTYKFRTLDQIPDDHENHRSEPWHWVSYPVVNSLTPSRTIASLFFNELLGKTELAPDNYEADVLNQIIWYEGNYQHIIELEPSSGLWGDHCSTPVSSPQGYKIQLKEETPSPILPSLVSLHHSGFYTPQSTFFRIYGSTNNSGQPYANWIGYFPTESAWPTDAFASIWNDITKIKAEDWTLYKDPNSGISMLDGKMLPLNCGDMVEVYTVNDHRFKWNSSNPTDPIIKPKPKDFVIKYLPDYTPVYIDLTGLDIASIKEIGLKLEGIYKGAVVVQDTLEQICVYLEESESLDSGILELVFSYHTKSQPIQRNILTITNDKLKKSFGAGDDNNAVYWIKLSQEDLVTIIPPVFTLHPNFPNPFNPTTTIRYSIEKPGQMSLEVYNVKGQLVKTLQQGYLDTGQHSVTWNGRDASGNSCASGVYFYKLRSNDRVLVRKMLMLK